MLSIADQNLLLGMLALQVGFVERDAVIAAMQAWTFDRSKPLGRILFEQGAISADRLALLEPLLSDHIRQHDGDPQKSLAAIGAVSSIRQALEAIGDGDLAKSLARLPAASSGPADGRIVDLTVTVARDTSGSNRFEILRPHAQGGLAAC